MGISKPKDQLTRREIEEILECNTRLFRNDANFPKYIVKLAMYLLEYHLEAYAKSSTASVSTGAFLTPGSVVHSPHDEAELDIDDRCPDCGSRLRGKRQCEKCGKRAY